MRGTTFSVWILLGLVIFKLYVKTLLDTNFHLYGVVHLWVGSKGVYRDIQLLGHVRQPPDHSHSQKVSEENVLYQCHDQQAKYSHLSLTFAPV